MKIKEKYNSNIRKWNLNHITSKYKMMNKNYISNHVADLEYDVPEFIINGIKNRCILKNFSYSIVDDDYYQKIIDWYALTKNVSLKKEWINNSYGVFFSLMCIYEALEKKGKNILITSPCYPPFYEASVKFGMNVYFEKLKISNDSFVLDMESLESNIIKNKINFLVICNPLNPTGRMYTKQELFKISSICYENNVQLISDEVHSDLTNSNEGFVSLLNIDNSESLNNIVLSSPTKLFNTGGMSSSYFICKNQELLKRIWATQDRLHLSNPNIFGMEIIKSGYTQNGIKWQQKMKLIHAEKQEWINQFIQNNSLPLKSLTLHSGFCMVILIDDSIRKVQQYKDEFIKEGVLVRFSDDFYDYNHIWFRLLLSSDEIEVIEIMNRIKKIIERIRNNE